MMPRGLRGSVVAFTLLAACGGQTTRTPAKAPTPIVEDWRQKLGKGMQECGETIARSDDHSCSLQKVHECLHDALTSCRPAHGLHLYNTSEGDPVRIDYFVAPKQGACVLVLLEDTGADPVGKRGVAERECRTTSWQPDPGAPSCQVLSPIDCKQVSFTPAR